MNMMQELEETGLTKLWEVDGPEFNKVDKVGVLMGPRGVLFTFILYDSGEYDINRPFAFTLNKDIIKRKLIEYIKSIGG